MNRVSFTLPDVGLREVKGMVFVEDGYLVLKIESALAGLIDNKQQIVKIEPKALEEVRIERHRFRRDRLVIKPRKANLLDTVPGDHASVIELRVKRRQREILQSVLDDFRALVAEQGRLETSN